jgi:hypothetical protein
MPLVARRARVKAHTRSSAKGRRLLSSPKIRGTTCMTIEPNGRYDGNYFNGKELSRRPSERVRALASEKACSFLAHSSSVSPLRPPQTAVRWWLFSLS